MLDLIGEDEDLVNDIWVTDEAHFHVSGFVNKRNFRYWSQAKPRALHEKPLHSQKVTVWCAISASGIIGPYFFENVAGNAVTVNANRYVEIHVSIFFNVLKFSRFIAQPCMWGWGVTNQKI